jgi:hypothetical protein
MSRVTISLSLMCAVLAGGVPLATATAASTKLTASEIVEKNISARGGLAAWRGVQTLSWSGKMEAGGQANKGAAALGKPLPAATLDAGRHVKQGSAAPEKAPPPATESTAQAQLPFVIEMKRPRKTRVEIVFNGQTAVQVYDGTNGWKVRPFLNRHEVESFTADELKAIATQADLDGYLTDFAAKGTKVDLDGVEQVEGKDAYKLKLTLKNTQVLHEWVDANSFLEVKVEGTPLRLNKKYHPVSILLRDYRAVNGLMLPHLIETRVQGVPATEKIQIEKIVVNPSLNETRFAKPT